MVIKYALDADAAVGAEVGVGRVCDALEECNEDAEVLYNS